MNMIENEKKSNRGNCLKCFEPIPDSRCHRSEGGHWCSHIIIQNISGRNMPSKYRYICSKERMDYISDVKLHSKQSPKKPQKI